MTFQKLTAESNPQCAAWLASFQKCVQSRDYEKGKTLFQNDLVCYGTVMESSHTLEDLVNSQWSKVWGATEGFAYNADETYILGGDASPVVTITGLWTSHSLGEVRQLRQGRCTITLVKSNANECGFAAVHSHFSITPDGSLTKALK